MKKAIFSFFLFSILGFFLGSNLTAQGKADRGKTLVLACTACHSFEQGTNVIGPSLYKVFGRKAGSIEGFFYSDGVKNAGFTWNEERLNKWLTRPGNFIAGARMNFFIAEEQDRKDIIAYLKQLSSN